MLYVSFSISLYRPPHSRPRVLYKVWDPEVINSLPVLMDQVAGPLLLGDLALCSAQINLAPTFVSFYSNLHQQQETLLITLPVKTSIGRKYLWNLTLSPGISISYSKLSFINP